MQRPENFNWNNGAVAQRLKKWRTSRWHELKNVAHAQHCSIVKTKINILLCMIIGHILQCTSSISPTYWIPIIHCWQFPGLLHECLFCMNTYFVWMLILHECLFCMNAYVLRLCSKQMCGIKQISKENKCITTFLLPSLDMYILTESLEKIYLVF